ncbi:MAG: chromate transporter [Erysipelotrichales bacterium]|nr:chromate transporter [Erysipelotrichales bacterium]
MRKSKPISEIAMSGNVPALFTTFLKIGAFSFGGGYAMIPLIREEIVTKHGWLEDEDMIQMIAIAESTPGPIAINAATFVGYRTAGFPGALAATFGIVLPSFLIIFGLSFVLAKFKSFKPVAYAFDGIRAGVLVLVFRGLTTLYRQCEKNTLFYVLVLSAFVLEAFFKINAVYILIGAALIGSVSSYLCARKEVTK